MSAMRSTIFFLTLTILLGLSRDECQAEDNNTHGDVSQQAIRDGELELLTRGPLHEAFAQPVVFEPSQAPRAPEAVPAPLHEVLPAFKPQGAVVWIAGYWAWNDVNDSWTWVTGTWRVPPAGKHWVSGYWTDSNDRRDWIAVGVGLLDSGSGQQVDLRASPAEGKAPAARSSIGPGRVLAARVLDFRKRSVCLARRIGDAHPARSIVGSVSVPLDSGRVRFCRQLLGLPVCSRRGWLFDPVGLTNSDSDTSKLSFGPSTLLNVDNVALELFARPKQSAYYFGDYFGASHVRHGIHAWYRYAQTAYDPIYTYQSWQYGRQNPGITAAIFSRRSADRPSTHIGRAAVP